jgi:hypothetical protein
MVTPATGAAQPVVPARLDALVSDPGAVAAVPVMGEPPPTSTVGVGGSR